MGFKQDPTTIFVDNNTVSGICKKYYQKTTLAVDERPVFLADRPGKSEYLPYCMGTWTWLFHEKIRRHIIVSSDHIMCKFPIHPEKLEKWIEKQMRQTLHNWEGVLMFPPEPVHMDARRWSGLRYKQDRRRDSSCDP